MKTSETDVLIVGGGAAGTTLALELVRRGVDVRTVDRLPGPAVTPRAIVVHARTAELIEQIDERLLKKYLDRCIRNFGYVLHFVDAKGKRSEVRPGIDFTGLDSRYPYMLIHGQADTENHMRDYLHDEYGYATEWGTACIGVEQDDDGVNSRVRRTLGLSQQQSDYQGTVLQNVDVFLNGFPDADDYVHYCAGTDHFIMIVKLPGGFFRLLLSDRGEATDPSVPPERAFMNLVDQHFDGVSLGDPVWHSKWESWVRLADTYRAGNVFLAGDSAHVHSTTGGQGMNCCMQDAFNLGWKLAMVIKGQARPELLDTYEAERRPIAEQVIWAASSLHEIFMGHGQDIAERAKKIEDRKFLDAVVGRCSGISYTYRDYVDATDDEVLAGPRIGDRAPDADCAGGQTLYSFLRHPGFTMLALPGSLPRVRTGVSRSATAIARFADRYAGVLRGHALEPSADLTRAYGDCDEDRLYLIRPDGYVGYRCRLADAEKLSAHLDEFVLS
jgi:NADPH-dependent dioxygenase